MEAGLAANCVICAPTTGAAVTVTVTEAVVLPVAPVAVRVYVVVCVGETDTEPVRGSTAPTFGEIEAAVAFETLQARVELWPAVMEAGAAVNCVMDAAVGDEVETDVVAEACNPSVFFTVKRKL
jgi:hypothetical protein